MSDKHMSNAHTNDARMSDDHGPVDSSEQELVLSSLERDQFAESKRQHLPQRHLKRGEVFVLMAMRLYLLFMTIVVIYQIVRGTR